MLLIVSSNSIESFNIRKFKNSSIDILAGKYVKFSNFHEVFTDINEIFRVEKIESDWKYD